MLHTITDAGLEIPTFKHKAKITCPPTGLVINPSVGCVNVWNAAAHDSSDIVQPFDATVYPQAVVDPSVREQGLKVAAKNGWPAAVAATPLASPQTPVSETTDANAFFKAPEFIG